MSNQSTHPPTENVVIAGDWHGNTRWATRTIGAAAAVGCNVLLHVGDFGIWPGREGSTYLAAVEEACAEHNVTILVTPGNHEDWNQINQWVATDRSDGWGSVKWFTDHIGILPRAHRFTITGIDGYARKFVSLGGAPSIDLQYRTPGVDWWSDEQITDEDIQATITGGEADVMLTHDAPEPCVPKVDKIITTNPGGWPWSVIEYCNEGRRRLTRAFNRVRPLMLFHGHYHVRDSADVMAGPPGYPFGCRVESLHMDGETGNAVVLDIATLHVTPIEAALRSLEN